MSKLTTKDILDMIEAKGGPQGLDLRGKDLSGIDLSRDTIQALAKERGGSPAWVSVITGGSINLMGVRLERAILVGTRLERANLMEAHLEGTILVAAHLEGANLWMAHLEGADLRGAHLNGADVVGAHLERADLRDARLDRARFHSVALDRTLMTRECFGRGISEENSGERVWARDAYLSIKQNFVSLGRYDDASWAYVKERQMERNSFFPSERGDRWVKERLEAVPAWLRCFARQPLYLGLRLWPWSPSGVRLDRPRWLLNLLFEVLAGYGEHWWKPLGWGAAIVAAFGLLYLGLAAVQMESGLPPSDIADYFIFSARCFATMSFNDLQPTGLWGRLLSAVEGMLGVSTLALFMYCLGRRMSGR